MSRKSSASAPVKKVRTQSKQRISQNQEDGKMNPGKMLAAILSLSVVLGMFVMTGRSAAQVAPAPGAEPAKVETPAAPAAEAENADPGAAPGQFTQGLLEPLG